MRNLSPILSVFFILSLFSCFDGEPEGGDPASDFCGLIGMWCLDVLAENDCYQSLEFRENGDWLLGNNGVHTIFKFETSDDCSRVYEVGGGMVITEYDINRVTPDSLYLAGFLGMRKN